MNNEIKEILEDYKKLAGEITLKLDNTAEYESWLIIQDYVDRFLDYIINLHEENKRSQQKINKALIRLNRIPDGLENINAYVALIVNETKEILQGDNKE